MEYSWPFVSAVYPHLWVQPIMDQNCFRKGDPLRASSCLTLRSELSKDTHMLTRQETSLGRGARAESSRGRGLRRTALPRGSQVTVSGFMVMGLVSRLSLANHSDSGSFLVVHALFSQDECQQERFWEGVGHVASSFDFPQTPLVGGSLLALCSLPWLPVVKQMVTMVPGQGGWFQSVYFP